MRAPRRLLRAEGGAPARDAARGDPDAVPLDPMARHPVVPAACVQAEDEADIRERDAPNVHPPRRKRCRAADLAGDTEQRRTIVAAPTQTKTSARRWRARSPASAGLRREAG